jgi:segregation and condensation protein B
MTDITATDTPPSETPQVMDERNQKLRLVEAILFAAAEPLDEATIAARLPEDSDTTALIADVAELYRNRGVNLVRIAGKWAFRTAPDLAPRLALEREAARRLSRAAIETLAIIAYHQPVTRAEIESIRGVAASRGTLDVLLEANWIKPGRRRQTPGRPVTWVTNEDFLDHFGLDNLQDLPGLKELKAAGLLDSRPAISVYSSVSGETDLLPDDASDEDESQAAENEPLEPEEDT